MIPWWADRVSPPRLVRAFGLVPPVAFDPDITARSATPVAGNPHPSAIRWSYIIAGDPDVAGSVPTMISGMPCPVGVAVGASGNDLAGWWRRPYTNSDLRLGNACGEQKATGGGEEDFLHRAISLIVRMVERAFGKQVVVSVSNLSVVFVRERRPNVLGFRDLVRCDGRPAFFSWTTVGGEKVARAVDTLPGMQAETQQNLPLEEVSAGKANGVRGMAPRTDNLIDGSRHGSVRCFHGGVPHMQYALPGGVLAICFIRGGAWETAAVIGAP
jgi:hypothetical protein